MLRREAFQYSIACRSEQEAVLHCLKALADFAEGGGHTRTAWGDVAVATWELDEGRVTLHFSTENKRSAFRRMARELLAGRWAEYAARDHDPPPRLGAERSGGHSAAPPSADQGMAPGPQRPEFPYLG